jgi:hypothetical protein
MSDDARQYAPAAARNREPIWAVLERLLPARGLVLEVASGSGEHTVHFARASGPQITYQPSDPDAQARASIDAEPPGLPNIRSAPRSTSFRRLAIASADVVSHEHDPHCTVVRRHRPCTCAARVLPPGGRCTSMVRSDAGAHGAKQRSRPGFLRARNPEWGVRHLEAVADLASAAGFTPPLIEPMPANNLSVLFRRQG